MTQQDPQDVTQVDLVVLGAGPGGESLASGAAAAGLAVVVVDRHLVGGECPYYGCIPSKMMIRAGDALAEAGRVSQLAGEVSVSPSWAPVHARIRDEATTNWDDTVAVDRLKDAGVTVHHGIGRLTGTGTVSVELPDGSAGPVYDARRGVVLNVGTRPAAPPVDGLADTPYWTNRDAVRTDSVPGSLVVLGGGPIGCELAQTFARFGSRVTVVQHGDRLLGGDEPEAGALLEEVFVAEGIRVMTGAELTRASYADGTFTLTLDDGEELVADQLLVAAGRTPNLDDVGLETVGLDPSARTVETDQRLRAGERLWAIGDITGRGAFTHMSMYQAAVALADITGTEHHPAEYHAVPHTTFTDPEVGGVGLTEQAARDAGLSVRVGSTPLEASSRGFTHGPGAKGVIKLVEDADRGVLVGATAAGPAGGEILGLLALAVHAQVPTATLRSMIYAYPTFHRAIETALSELA
ncbi:NAD(P)/FAD-dependent oxidoreductase [uncultured Nocardioides sp.]|uniref:dihydrolipoyl dehydrogenase family protein n=1 Tax=uncultured Nocardioides sp. TaxID=198441 RepID=UPI002637F92B|nr:NAD(P)/FAD-dependent oxidoreductase [uncultured Nocardioides sp.]